MKISQFELFWLSFCDLKREPLKNDKQKKTTLFRAQIKFIARGRYLYRRYWGTLAIAYHNNG